MNYSYDADLDNLFIKLCENSGDVLTDSFSMDGIEFGLINLDFNEENKIVGIEIQSASKLLPSDLVKKLSK